MTTFGYDPAGRVITAANPDTACTFERDLAGRIVAETCNGRTVTSVYDPAGRRVRRTTPSGAQSVWEYDPNGMPASLSTAGHTVRFTHDAAGREIQRRLGTGVSLAQGWDVNHRLASQTLTATTSGPAITGVEPGAARENRLIQRRDYTYSPDGYVTDIDDFLAGPREYTLDPARRVTAVTGPGWQENYAYDPAGNITNATWPTPPPGPAGHGHPPAGPLDAAQGGRDYTGTLIHRAGTIRYEHDAQGRITLRQQKRLSGKPRTWRYTWDADDRLTDVTTPDGHHWHYHYDPFGRRITKQRLDDVGAVAEQVTFTWDGDVLAEQTHTTDDDGTRITCWDWEPDTYRPVTQTDHHAPGNADDADQNWYDTQFHAIITDLIGTPTELINPDGNVDWNNRTTLWGNNVAANNGNVDCSLRFPGQYSDSETGLNYNYRRHYDPVVGRYTSNDPLGLAPGPNPRTYVHNPLRWLDPLGLAPCVPNSATSDLSAFGNRADPRAPRASDMEIGSDGMLIPQGSDSPMGASTFADPARAPLSGHYHTIPEGTPMPPGMAVVRDGVDVGGLQPESHATIYPTEPMTPQTFIDRFRGLPWQYGGKK